MVNRSGYRITCFRIRIYIFKICVLALYRALTGNCARGTSLFCSQKINPSVLCTVHKATLRQDALHTQRLQPPSCSTNSIRWHHNIWEPITAHTIRYINCIPNCSWHSWTAWPLKMGCPKMLVWKYHSVLCKTPKELRSHLHCSGILKSHTLYPDIILVHALICYTMNVNCIKS